MIYFVKGNTIGSDFGFPRLAFKKRYKWYVLLKVLFSSIIFITLVVLMRNFNRKKMNFTTDLPKKNPIVSYIVASAVKCEKFFPGC